MLGWENCWAVERVNDRLSGAVVFKGTRVPVAALFQNLEGGANLDQFLEWFQGVSREQAEAVLKHAEDSLETPKAVGGFFETAMSLKLNGPPDWSTNLHEYLYGDLVDDNALPS